jgi:putative phage-type endonuclease
MLINQDFTQDRTKYIGGSDIGAILGLSKFRTPLDVWMEKTGKEVKKLDSLPLRFGSFAEEFVASEYARATGFELLQDESIYLHPSHSFMSAHMDRFVLVSNMGNAVANQQDKLPTRILECKTANPFTRSEWGEPGTDQVPMSYLCQCLWYMAITGIEQCDIAVLFGNNDFRIYEVERDLELEVLVIEKALHFWHEYVLKDIAPPAQSEADYQSLFKKSDPTKTIEANPKTVELITQLKKLNTQSGDLDSQITQMKQQIMQEMQEAEILSYQGNLLATWKAPKPGFRLDSKRLELEEKAIFERYQTPVQNSRRLVIKTLEA